MQWTKAELARVWRQDTGEDPRDVEATAATIQVLCTECSTPVECGSILLGEGWGSPGNFRPLPFSHSKSGEETHKTGDKSSLTKPVASTCPNCKKEVRPDCQTAREVAEAVKASAGWPHEVTPQTQPV